LYFSVKLIIIGGLKMMKIIIVLLICFVAVGLIFGCTETTNTDNTNSDGSGNVVTQPNNTNNTNDGAGTGDEIPLPPALPE
jgi:hypothetical protein